MCNVLGRRFVLRGARELNKGALFRSTLFLVFLPQDTSSLDFIADASKRSVSASRNPSHFKAALNLFVSVALEVLARAPAQRAEALTAALLPHVISGAWRVGATTLCVCLQDTRACMNAQTYT